MPQYSLDTLTLHGFRGLSQLRLDDLGLVNILVGPNNCGKTSVLEAISILCDPYNPTEWLAMVRRRDFGRLDESRVQSLRWCFRQDGELTDPDALFQGECEIGCHGAFPLRKLTVSYQDLSGEPDPESLSRIARAEMHQLRRDAAEPLRGAEIVQTVEWDASPKQPTMFESSGSSIIETIALHVWEYLTTTFQEYPRRGRLRTETLTPYSYQINRTQVRSRSRQLFSDRPSLILDLIRQFDPDIEGVEIASFRGGRPAIYLKHRRLGAAPLSIFGDALRRAVLLASTLPTLGGGGILLLDELETGIHVSNLDRVFSWLVSVAGQLNVQVIATTHSLEAVDAIASSAGTSIENVVAYHLEQTEETTSVRRIAGELLVRLRRERGLDVR